MCGIFGVASLVGRTPSVDDDCVARLRDMLAHRGPDDAGLWRRRNVALAHRRLAVLDRTPAGAQPMATPDGRFVIVYNGELYNDEQIRQELIERGAVGGGFRTHCDTETVLRAFAQWGTEAFARLRGMYALAVYDTRLDLLTLARDPLGVKPLYFWSDEREIVFASEPGPILAHPLVEVRPNMQMLSAYLTTIRTVLGADTLFEGVYALGAGQVAQCSLSGRSPMIRLLDVWSGPAVSDCDVDEASAAESTRSAVVSAVRSHLRSDAPLCALLSGGLDSSIIASIASGEVDELRTYCAGASSGDVAGEAPQDDLSHARLVAGLIGSRHAEALIDEDHFTQSWPRMVRQMGVPLSTPNEVAIHAVASRLAEDGCVVTVSGEGADELFAGYESPMMDAWRFVNSTNRDLAGGRFQLLANAWIPPEAKSALFHPGLWSALEDDAWLVDRYEREFERCANEVGEQATPIDAHLRFHRRVNLTGLLQRLDTATMLASVEGRTPFADQVVAEHIEAMPMAVKFDPGADSPLDIASGAPAATATRSRTKIALRRAFQADLPEQIVERPKASFPLPFQDWLAAGSEDLRRSRFARSIFNDEAIEFVAAEPTRNWRLAWPMMNIALWGERWWG